MRQTQRPRWLPVYDQVVRCVLGRPKSFWLDLHGALRADNHALHRELTALRQSADVPALSVRCGSATWCSGCTTVRIINREAVSGPESVGHTRESLPLGGQMIPCCRRYTP
ncbi:DUF6308 family protein [Streptomyces sp. NBC_00647]|uniref:DUF6308 family protein n=1 Tax=Streptomyces sp. NBC_00647 TaxID=2975796 RepID=UPI0032485B28